MDLAFYLHNYGISLDQQFFRQYTVVLAIGNPTIALIKWGIASASPSWSIAAT